MFYVELVVVAGFSAVLGERKNTYVHVFVLYRSSLCIVYYVSVTNTVVLQYSIIIIIIP
jgi:hypothetical protein